MKKIILLILIIMLISAPCASAADEKTAQDGDGLVLLSYVIDEESIAIDEGADELAGELAEDDNTSVYLWIILGAVAVIFFAVFITTVIGNKKNWK